MAQQNDWRIAVRFGTPLGVGIALMGCVVILLRAADPSPQLRVLAWLWLLIAAICAFLAGMFAARSAGSLRIGIGAGILTCALAATIVFAIFVFGPAYQRQQTSPDGKTLPPVFNVLLIAIVLLLFSVMGGGLFGGLASLPGALLGRAQARAERRNTPSLPEQIPAHNADDALTELAELASVSSGDITLNPSWSKGLLIFLTGLLFTVICYAMASSGANVVIGGIGVGLFSLVLILAPINFIFNRPLLRFSDEGIAYKGAYSLWRRGEAPWRAVYAITLYRAPSRLFGRYELAVLLDEKRIRRLTFQNWQLPLATRKLLRIAAIRYHEQIEANDVALRGIE